MATGPVLEYINGRWIAGGSETEPDAVIVYADEPCPETGHEGWCWWALGAMGEARSLEDAKAGAQHALERRRRRGP